MIQLKTVRKWHLLLIWPATFSVVIYLLSAFAHPLAGWVGPQAKHKAAPHIETDITSISSIEKIIFEHQLSRAISARLVPFKDQMLLQVTLKEGSKSRYFSIKNHREFINHSEQQAIWLAEYYLGNPLKINSVEFKEGFDADYPVSNKLLPVYIFNYDTNDALKVIIHPQSMALVSISNDWKRAFKNVFRNFHAFDWLNEFEEVRLLLVSTILSLILIMSITGLYFLLMLKRKKTIKKTDRRWHRRLAYPVIVPLFLFSISGFYHLFQSSLYHTDITLPTKPALHLQNWSAGLLKNNGPSLPNFNGLSLISAKTPLYRIYFKNEARDHTKNKVIYMDAVSGVIMKASEEDIIKTSISRRLNMTLSEIQHSKLITRFADGYSFKNKRLPVWQVDFVNGQRFYIDPVNHDIIQFSDILTRMEGSTFSAVHMWGWLKPFIGHFGRDIVFTIILLISFILSIVGLSLYLSNKRNKKIVKSGLGSGLA